jgi:hypothetical protein
MVTGEPVLTKQEQIDIVQDMFEELVAFVVNECPTLSDMGVDDTYDAVLGFIRSNDAR